MQPGKILLSLLMLSVQLCLFFSAHGQSFTRITSSSNPIVNDFFQSGGGSWIDINNDGWLDLFVSNGNLDDEKNSLFYNLGDGNFKKVVVGNIVTDGGSSIGSTWADYDNDGFLDCFVTNRNFFGNFLYHGNGDTAFTKITSGSIVSDMKNSNSSSWTDLNNDGHVDLYDVVFSQNDLLYKNDGTSFQKDSLNMIVNDNSNFSIPGAWADFNNDRLPDLFIGNSGTENDAVYVNNGSFSFTEVILPDGRSTTGGSWADFDNDGDLDLFAANYLNSGNLYYLNQGPPDYTLQMVTSGTLAESGKCVGSAWGDIDNDGDLDLFVSDDGSSNLLYLNDGPPDYSFTKVLSGAPVDDIGSSFGAVFGDYDNDGQLDLFVANHLAEGNFLYHNNGNSNHWITIKCTGITSNRAAIGAHVHVRATIGSNTMWQMQEVSGQTGYNSQNLWLHFGLGPATVADSIIINWPSGENDTCYNVNADQFYDATEGSCLTSVSVHELSRNNPASDMIIEPNPFILQTDISYSVAVTGKVEIDICGADGKKITTLINEERVTGRHHFQFNAASLDPGIYFCTLRAGSYIEHQKMIVVH